MFYIKYKTALDVIILICLIYLWNEKVKYSAKNNNADRLDYIIIFTTIIAVSIMIAELIWSSVYGKGFLEI